MTTSTLTNENNIQVLPIVSPSDEQLPDKTAYNFVSNNFFNFVFLEQLSVIVSDGDRLEHFKFRHSIKNISLNSELITGYYIDKVEI